MSVKKFSHNGVDMAYAELGDTKASVVCIWAHGWARSHKDFMPLAEVVGQDILHIFLDFPGFGKSPNPPLDWGTAEYADLVAAFIKTLPKGQKVWVGHSFGCRVGVQLAARHSGAVDGLVLAAAAGLKRKRPLRWKIKTFINTRVFKLMKWFYGRVSPEKLEALKSRVGSSDYRKAGALRPLFVKVVNENLVHQAKQVDCPVQLVFGENDIETPPALGEKYVRLMPQATLKVLPNLGHNDILTAGASHVVVNVLKMIERVKV